MENDPIIVDMGSIHVKCGYSKDKEPTIMANIAGVHRHIGIGIMGMHRDLFLGNEAIDKRGILRLRRPIVHDGTPINWNYIEKVWSTMFFVELNKWKNEGRLKFDQKKFRGELFYDFGYAPIQHPIVLSDLKTQDEASSAVCADKICEHLFEEFEIPALSIANNAVLSLYAKGNTDLDGIVCDIGANECRVVPVKDGLPIRKSIRKMSIGTHAIHKELNQKLADNGYPFTTAHEKMILEDIAKAQCFVSLDAEKQSKKGYKKEYELPDGSKMTLGPELFTSCEVLFGSNGVVSTINDCITSLSKQNLKGINGQELYFVGGGGTICGMRERVGMGIVGCTLGMGEFDGKEDWQAWIGGCIYGKMLSTRKDEWVKREEYNEVGSVHRKVRKHFWVHFHFMYFWERVTRSE